MLHSRHRPCDQLALELSTYVRSPSSVMQTSKTPPLANRSIAETLMFSHMQRVTTRPSSRLTCTMRLTRGLLDCRQRRCSSAPSDRAVAPARRNDPQVPAWKWSQRGCAPERRVGGTPQPDRASLELHSDFPERLQSVVERPSVSLRLSKRERTHVSQPRKCLQAIAARYVLVTASVEISEQTLAEHLERGGVCHLVGGSIARFGLVPFSARARRTRRGIVFLEYGLHLILMRLPPLSFFDLRHAVVRCAVPYPRERTRRLRTGGNARAHARASPLPPRSAPGRRGRERTAGLNCGQWVQPRLFGPVVVRRLGL